MKDASRSRSRGMAGGQNQPIVADTPIVIEPMDVDEEVVDEVVDNDGDVAMDIDEVDEEDAPVGGKKRKAKKTHRRRKLRGGQPVLDAEVVEEVAEMNGGRRHKRRTMKRRKSHKRR